MTPPTSYALPWLRNTSAVPMDPLKGAREYSDERLGPQNPKSPPVRRIFDSNLSTPLAIIASL